MKSPGCNRKFQYWPFFLFFLGLAAIFLGLALFELLGKWELLSTPPIQVDSLVTFTSGDIIPYLVVANADGTQTLCTSMDGNNCEDWWSPLENRFEHSDEYSCNFKHPRFIFGRLHFERVVDCMEDRYTAGGYGTERYVVVLDDRHQLWLWNSGVLEGTDFISLSILFILLCFVAGFITALFWNSISVLLFPGRIDNRAENRKAFLKWLEHILRISARVGSITGLLYAFFVLVNSFYPPPANNFWILINNPRVLFLTAVALCTLVAWRKPLVGGISGMLCTFISFLKLGISTTIFDYILFALVLLMFISLPIIRTLRDSMENKEHFPWFTLLVLFFVGLGLSIIFAVISQSGLIGYWEPLESPPEKVSELITISGLGDLSPDFVISSKDGNQFECTHPKIGCHGWEQKSEEMRLTRQTERFACNLQHPRFTVISRPFTSVTDCLEILYTAGGYGTSRYIFVMDELGNLWAGTFDEDEQEIFLMFLAFLPIGLLGSFSTALVWNYLSSRIRRNRKKRD